MMRLFLDTNIVIDLLDRREPFCHDAVQLFTMAYYKKVQLIVSPMTYTTASFLLHRHGAEGVRNLLSNFRQLSRVATTNERTVDDSLASQLRRRLRSQSSRRSGGLETTPPRWRRCWSTT